MGSEWLNNVSVCPVHGDSSWYVCYEDKTHRLRLTHRGTWSIDDMDIYWYSRADAYAALHVAPCPLEDPYKTIADLRSAVNVLATNLRSYIMDQAVGDWTKDISDEVNANPIAAEAVRKAGG